jgi:carbohydrate-selective porin OprB
MRSLGGVAILCVLAAPAQAQVHDDPCACSPAKPGFMRRDALTGDWGDHRTWLEDHGLTIGPSYTGEVFASPGLDRPVVFAGLAALSIDYDPPTIGSFHVVGFGIHGDGLSEQLMDLYGVSNNVATNEVRLFEAWFDQPIGPGGVRAGLLAADQELDLTDHSSVLMNSTFGVIGQISSNILGPVYPVATPGVSGRVEVEPVAVRAAVYDGDQTNTHGMPTHIGDSVLAVGEVEGWSTVKLGGWVHSARPDGVYVVGDRKIRGRVGVFARFGISPAGPIEIYADAGVRGPPGRWRIRDFCGLGVAYSRTTELGHHGVIEATYQWAATGWLTIQPDMQIVVTPDRTALVGGLRGTIAF